MQVSVLCQFSLLTVLEVDRIFPSCLASCTSDIPVPSITVVNRVDRREEIFRDEPDRERFLSTLAEACRKSDWQFH
jgi:hypothetical protein